MLECNRHYRIDICRLVPTPDIVVAMGKRGLVALGAGFIPFFIPFPTTAFSPHGDHICYED